MDAIERIVGVIVEYNPLHNGHVHHLEASRQAARAETVIAVMSGHWLQRGEPAFMNKWARAETALLAGADLVLELPVIFSTQPAEWFAYGAISALTATGVVDAVCFGSESGQLAELKALADRLASEPAALYASLQEQLKKGLPYPAAYAAAVKAVTGLPGAELLAEPNNSLGFHYLLSLARLGSGIEPYTIQRVKAGYHQEHLPEGGIASATAIRKQLLTAVDRDAALASIAEYVPPGTLEVLRREWSAGRAPLHWERYRLPLLHRLIMQSPEQLARYREVTEGLEYRLKKTLASLKEEASIEELMEGLKTKRYTRTKLQRMMTAVYLEHLKERTSADQLRDGVPYLRVLGFTDRGRSLLHRMKQTASVPVITTVNRDEAPANLSLDISATAAYVLGYEQPNSKDWFADYYHPPVYIPLGGKASK